MPSQPSDHLASEMLAADDTALEEIESPALEARIARVPESAAGRRFDAALAELFPEFSRSRLSLWIKSGDALLDGVERSQHEDRHAVAGRTDGATDIDPVRLGNQNVEYDRVVLVLGDQREQLRPRSRLIDRVPRLGESAADRLPELPVVFGECDPHRENLS